MEVLILAACLFMIYKITYSVWLNFKYVIESGKLSLFIGGFRIHEHSISKIISIRKGAKTTYVYGLSTNTITLLILEKEFRVSPKNEGKFIHELIKHNPQIELEGGLKKMGLK